MFNNLISVMMKLIAIFEDTNRECQVLEVWNLSYVPFILSTFHYGLIINIT